MRDTPRYREVGFTLLELLVVLGIAMLLVAVARPYYGAYLIQGYMGDAQNAMEVQAHDLQRYAQDNETYPTSCASPVTVSNFTITCVGASTTYTITATGSGVAAGLVFTLDNLGNKVTTSTKSGWSGNTLCWTRDPSGDCVIK